MEALRWPVQRASDRSPRVHSMAASLDAMVEHNRHTAKTHSGIWRDLAVRKRRTDHHGAPRAPRYVLWGEGTTDEMCLGLLQVTRG